MLHTVNKSAFSSSLLSTCLGAACDGDDILLLNDGVYGLVQGSPNEAPLRALIRDGKCRVLALREDVERRGLSNQLLAGVEMIDYPEFVKLAAHHSVTQSWY